MPAICRHNTDTGMELVLGVPTRTFKSLPSLSTPFFRTRPDPNTVHPDFGA